MGGLGEQHPTHPACRLNNRVPPCSRISRPRVGPPYPNTTPPSTSFAKTEPSPLVFNILSQKLLLSRVAQLRPPTSLNWHFPTLTCTPLPVFKASRTSFAKNEPPRLGFWALTQNPPPHASPDCGPPPP
jgi:hypothetical protein